MEGGGGGAGEGSEGEELGKTEGVGVTEGDTWWVSGDREVQPH